MTNNFLIIFGGILLAILGWLIFLTVKYRALYKKGEIIFADANPKKIANLINDYFDAINKVEAQNKKIEKSLLSVSGVANSSLHRVGFTRYNPFGEVGGDQSFSLALLNAKNDGFVISSIHSREGTRVYSKSIKDGQSSYNLSNEEKKVIIMATKEKGEENVREN